ncbi:3-oxoacyl-ACP reductase family protein [Bradyrhizobium japonicum]|uniref:3-oxoacyl-ACP reductase family protein n=1 Tax=Bradyrhizobium japonicum TaxID=375 RepID=UPI001BA67B4D|nr:3-oxoacyl-ACP reductase family protein [Bradyrhizobium japonicum]MBR0915968.1 3-oxoacyl-ACP reductase FabG [Bradyrhizobium japonicum]
MSSKVALVFGGARGIGAAIAVRLAKDGFDIALTYVSRPDSAGEIVAAIENAGRKAVAIKADSADPAAIRAAVAETVDRLGVLDAVVVNAGILRLGPVEQFSLEDLDLILDVNIRGVFLAIQAAAGQMRDGGRIITIGSNTAIRTGTPGGSVYAMTKAAVASMVRGVALDLAPRRITVNNVQPGPTETDMTVTMVSRLKEIVPLKRVGEPSEIAALVSYLAGPESGYMTGASLTIDGGYVL